MNEREQYVEELAGAMLKQAFEEVGDSPLAKHASESDLNDAAAEKLAGVFEEAVGVYKQAEETMGAAEAQEAAAREVLASAGIDPDAVIAAAEEAAAAELA